MQILIYVGAVCVLIFFAIMLTRADAGGEEAESAPLRQNVLALLAVVTVGGILGWLVLTRPLATTGVRLTITLAREMQRSGVRYGVSSACIGGGQGIALLLENPNATA